MRHDQRATSAIGATTGRDTTIRAPVEHAGGGHDSAPNAARDAAWDDRCDPRAPSLSERLSEHVGEALLLLEQAPMGLVVAEAPSGRILVFNAEAERILGRPAIAADRTSDYLAFGSIHHDGSRFAPGEHPLARALAGEHLRDRLVRYRRDDGVVVRLSVNASPIRSQAGDILGATATFVDVTERYLLEARVRSRLERLIAVRDEEARRQASDLSRLGAGLQAISRTLDERVHRRTAELAYQARHDALTGLPNRILFEERLERAIEAAERYGRMLAVLFIDFDGFKGVNDDHGHAAGDAILRQAARRLRAALRRTDTLARYGGDEFIALASEILGPEDACRVAEELRNVLSAPFEFDGRSVALRASIGVSVYPNDAPDAARLKRSADQAMYLAKRTGSSGVVMFGAPEVRLFGSVGAAAAEPGARPAAPAHRQAGIE